MLLHQRESPPGPSAASHRRVHSCFVSRFGSQDYGPTVVGLPLAHGGVSCPAHALHVFPRQVPR